MDGWKDGWKYQILLCCPSACYKTNERIHCCDNNKMKHKIHQRIADRMRHAVDNDKVINGIPDNAKEYQPPNN